MSSSNTTKIPRTLGANNLTESFGKIALSAELKEYLSALDAQMIVSYSSGSDKPDISIRDRAGKLVCSIDEFTKLGGFRRWVSDELKNLDKIEASSKKVELLAYFYRRAAADGESLGERINEGNETRFKQFNAMVKIVEDNLEKITGTVTGDFRTYLLQKGELLVKVFYKLMLACMLQEAVPKDALEVTLFKYGIPKWVHSKFVDKSFTNNVRVDATVLLFPKGNYLRGIALTKKELADPDFLSKNALIMKRSGSIVMLANHDWKSCLPTPSKEAATEVEEFLGNHMWVLMNQYSVTELLEIRAGGKGIPSFKARQKPNPTGTNARPENETQRVMRESSNFLGELNANWLHLANFVIPCMDPKEMFWSKILDDQITWDITPTHNLYHNLIEANADLKQIHELSSEALIALMAEIVIQHCRIPLGSAQGKDLLALFAKMKDSSSKMPAATAEVTTSTTELNVDLDEMSKTKLSDETITNVKKFLGVKAPKEEKKKERKGGPSAVRLHSSVLNELSLLQDHKLYDPVKNWLATSFKTGNKAAVQRLAAERVAGEVLMHQNTLFGEEFDEFNYLNEVEEYDEGQD